MIPLRDHSLSQEMILLTKEIMVKRLLQGKLWKDRSSGISHEICFENGAGLTFTLAPQCGYNVLQTSCPEAMFMEGGDRFITHFEIDNDATIGIGPGLGIHRDTQKALFTFLKDYQIHWYWMQMH